MRDLSLGVGAVLETRVISRNLNLKRKIVFSKFVYLVGETALRGIKFQGKRGGFVGVWDSIIFTGVKEKGVDGPMWLLWLTSELTDVCF